MLVPERSYSPNLLEEQPLDKSADFIQQCRGEGFHIKYVHTKQIKSLSLCHSAVLIWYLFNTEYNRPF